MRRSWTYSLAIGGGAALLGLAFAASSLAEPVVRSLGEWYRSHGWTNGAEAAARIRWVEFAVAALAPVALAWAMIEATRTWQRVLLAGLGILLVALLSPALALHGLAFDPVSPAAASLLAAAGVFVFARTEPGRRKRLLEDALGSRVSSKVFANLLESPLPPDFGPTTREVTTLVCRLLPAREGDAPPPPAEALKMGSLFLRSVSAFLLSRGAYLEESSPERIRVAFGILRDDDDHAARACQAALDLRGRLRGLAQEFESRWFHPLRWGVGLASGTMAVGLCGEPGGKFLGGRGGQADFADRLALANARLGSDLLVSPGLFGLIRDRFEARPLELVYDPEGQRLLEIYQLLAAAEEFPEEERLRRDSFWRGVVRLREGDYEAALECLSRARLPGADDRPLALLLAQAQEGVAGPESRPLRLIREFTAEGRSRLVERL